MCAHLIAGQHVRPTSSAGGKPHLRVGNAAKLTQELVLQGLKGLRGSAVLETLVGDW